MDSPQPPCSLQSFQGGETDYHTQGDKDPAVPRPPILSPAYSRISKNLSETKLAGEHGEFRAGTQTSLGLCRLSVRSQMWLGLTDTGPVADPSAENTGFNLQTGLSGAAVHVLNRSANSHREASSSWPTAYETYSVVSQKQLEGTGITRKGHFYPHSQVSAPASEMVKWWLEEAMCCNVNHHTQ